MNIKRTCVDTNPAGKTDTMCELIIESPAMLRINNIIETAGTYTVSGWIYADTAMQISVILGKTKCDTAIAPGWNKLLLTILVSTPGPVYIEFGKGKYRIYKLQINQGNIPTAYEGESIVKPIIFGMCSDAETVVNNNSDDDIGFICRIHFNEKASSPKIYITESNEYIEIQGMYRKDETIQIDTRAGHKSIKAIYHGEEKNIINRKSAKSKWLKLKRGINHVGYSAETGAEYVLLELKYSNEYEGV